MILTIIDKLDEWIQPFKSFIIRNHGNPFMWLVFFLSGIAIFAITYSALNRNGE